MGKVAETWLHLAESAAYAAEQRKNIANGPKCNELGWVCIPLAVEHYVCWGSEPSKHYPDLDHV